MHQSLKKEGDNLLRVEAGQENSLSLQLEKLKQAIRHRTPALTRTRALTPHSQRAKQLHSHMLVHIGTATHMSTHSFTQQVISDCFVPITILTKPMNVCSCS